MLFFTLSKTLFGVVRKQLQRRTPLGLLGFRSSGQIGPLVGLGVAGRNARTGCGPKTQVGEPGFRVVSPSPPRGWSWASGATGWSANLVFSPSAPGARISPRLTPPDPRAPNRPASCLRWYLCLGWKITLGKFRSVETVGTFTWIKEQTFLIIHYSLLSIMNKWIKSQRSVLFIIHYCQ